MPRAATDALPNRMWRAGRGGLLAWLLVLTAAGLGAAHPASVRAADGGLVVIAQATYRVLPDEGRLRVVIDATATSYEPDTPDAQVFYSGLTFAVQPGASNVSAVADGAAIGARITEQAEGYTAIEVTFAHGVFFQESYRYTVTFDLADPGGAPGRDLRISRSLLAFPVWAFGTEQEPGGSVRVDLPAGYALDVQGSEMVASDGPDGGTVLTANPTDPFAFFAYVTADRPGAFVPTPLILQLGSANADLVVRAWEDDPDWGTRMVGLLTDGLRALQSLIGVEYPVPGSLSVEEAATSRLGEYAGIYNEATGVIRVRYDADAIVGLHEAAHIWFSGDMFTDRWINEAWAEYYAVAAADRIGETGATYELTDDLLGAKIPLNDWGGVGVESLDVEDFAYAASYELAGKIAERTTLDDLAKVWRAVAGNEMAYQPLEVGVVPHTGHPAALADWQRLLDLLEERTGATYDDLWSGWVVNDQQYPLLAERTSTRFQYQVTLTAAADWELPESIRVALEGWDFDTARGLMDAALPVLADRDEIYDQATILGLSTPDILQETFEADDDLQASATVAGQELDALDAITSAIDALEDEPSALESIGLIGVDPDAGLARARDAFESGNPEASTDAARDAEALRDDARDLGTQRAVLGASGILAFDGLVLAVVSARSLRRRRVAAPMAAPLLEEEPPA